jgi:hypothetical protein
LCSSASDGILDTLCGRTFVTVVFDLAARGSWVHGSRCQSDAHYCSPHPVLLSETNKPAARLSPHSAWPQSSSGRTRSPRKWDSLSKSAKQCQAASPRCVRARPKPPPRPPRRRGQARSDDGGLRPRPAEAQGVRDAPGVVEEARGERRPAWIYECALSLFTEISCNYRDSTYKRE